MAQPSDASSNDRVPPSAAPDAGGGGGTSGSAHPGGLGSRAHIRQTLERARSAIRESRERASTSRSLLARAEALADASGRVLQESLAIRAQLRASVTAYVRHLKDDGIPSERVVVLVKTAVRDAAPPELDAWDARDLMEDVVRWSIEAYYHAA